MRNPINKLVEYKGGGYDGCFWEWNYAYFDKQGEFHNIRATGYKGCKTEEAMLNFLGCEAEGKDYYLIRAGMKSSLRDFYKESNIENVKGVLSWFENNTEMGGAVQDLPCLPTCPCCGNEVRSAEEMCLTDYTGDGGIGIQYTGWVCDECHSAYSCHYCGEFYGKEYEGFDNEGYCEYCYDHNPDHETTEKEMEDAKDKFSLYSKAEAIEKGLIAFDMDTIRYMLRELVITDFTVLDQFDEPKMRQYFDSFDADLCFKYYEASLEIGEGVLA